MSYLTLRAGVAPRIGRFAGHAARRGRRAGLLSGAAVYGVAAHFLAISLFALPTG
jgi:hypothetical protein